MLRSLMKHSIMFSSLTIKRLELRTSKPSTISNRMIYCTNNILIRTSNPSHETHIIKSSLGLEPHRSLMRGNCSRLYLCSAVVERRLVWRGDRIFIQRYRSRSIGVDSSLRQFSAFEERILVWPLTFSIAVPMRHVVYVVSWKSRGSSMNLGNHYLVRDIPTGCVILLGTMSEGIAW